MSNSTEPGATGAVLDPQTAVVHFLQRVREHLADLPEEERRELTEGLAADLDELVADQGVSALGDPRDYAGELRQAAGLPPAGARGRGRPALEPWLDRDLDRVHDAWDRTLARLPKDVAGWLEVVQPAWWVVRAWVAVSLGLALVGRDRSVGMIPEPGGEWVLGLLVLGLAVVVSVQIGRRRWWPGTSRRERGHPASRAILLGLNSLALLAAPWLVGLPMTQANADEYAYENWGYVAEVQRDGRLHVNGEPVQNVYPYDAQGQPLIGVQLFDQSGRALPVQQRGWGSGSNGAEYVLAPWLNGLTKRYNVFPLPQAQISEETGKPMGEAALSTWPYASVPPVVFEGIVPTQTAPGAPPTVEAVP